MLITQPTGFKFKTPICECNVADDYRDAARFLKLNALTMHRLQGIQVQRMGVSPGVLSVFLLGLSFFRLSPYEWIRRRLLFEGIRLL